MSFSGTADSLGYQQATVNTATGLTLPSNTTPAYALITIEAQAVRWRDDGTAPTAAVGMPLAVGATLKYDANNINSLQFIGQVAGAIINVTYYGKK